MAMNSENLKQLTKDRNDFEALKETAGHFETLFGTALANGPKEEILEAAKAAKKSSETISDYTASVTVQAIAERMLQHAENYDPANAAARDAVNDLGLATKLLIECSLMPTALEDIRRYEMLSAA
jgi:hypothetical protein